MLLAAYLFLSGARHYDWLQFAGFRQIKNQNSCSLLTADCKLKASGILGIIRHPWYTGGIIIVWARTLDLSALIVNLIISVYFIIGGFLEEKKLLQQFGKDYRDYQSKVSMFFPVKWINARIKALWQKKHRA